MGFRHLAEPVSHVEIVKKSRFVTRLRPISDPAQLKAALDTVRKTEYGARHHATASVIGHDAVYQRSSDDGEPAGSAGMPMLQVLRRARVTDILAVVSRHFGGVLLGKAGLARAYAGGVSAALAEARLVTREPQEGFEVSVGAAEAGRAGHLLRAFAATRADGVVRAVYGESAAFELWLAPGGEPALRQLLAAAALGAAVRPLGERLVANETPAEGSR
ncbi:MAG: IMPACT family protein [Bifidobacteriaceae bacterium]|jgi:uncharacterized YigZ family protein|nr:IMPACT family protein [Bifidobacteriaceae bacterium]